MARADDSIVWTGRQLTTRWLLTPDHAAPAVFALCRQTLDHRGDAVVAYHVHGYDGALSPDGWRAWLAGHGLCGERQLAVSLLIISETLDPSGAVRECALERRRADVDGPFSGRPARVEFLGPARAVRLYEVDAHQRLIELAAEQELAEGPAADVLLDGEEAALRAHLGDGFGMLCRRAPLLAESAAGFCAIFHLDHDGDVIGCGLGWHGPQAYAIVADFPRMSQPLALPPDVEPPVRAALDAKGLIRKEVRIDAKGLAVMATDASGHGVHIVRLDGGRAVVTPYRASPEAGSEDQRRWIRFAEDHQGACLLDAYADGLSDALVVLMVDPTDRVWRYRVDADGLEIDRELAEDTAVAQRYRAARQPGGASAPGVPAEQVRGLIAGLRETAGGRPAAIDAGLKNFAEACAALGFPRTAAAASESARAAPPGPAAAGRALGDLLPRLERLLSEEQDPPLMGADEPRPAEPGQPIRFPLASHHLAEATRSLSGRLPAGAMFHAMAAARAALTAAGVLVGRDATAGHDWSTMLRAAAASPALPNAARQALAAVERAWLLAGADAVDKYTEREAEMVGEVVEALVRRLAEA